MMRQTRILKTFCLFIWAVFWGLPGVAQIRFVKNLGQWPSSVLFRADIPDGYLSVEKNALLYTRIWSNNLEFFHLGPQKEDSLIVHNERIEFIGANSEALGSGENIKPEYHNYFIGDDPSKWVSRVPVYGKVIVRDVYPGIDLEIFGRDGRSVKYNFLVHPGANPESIRLKYLGQESMHLKDGSLHIQTPVGDILEEAPIAYQLEGKSDPGVNAGFRLEDNILSFQIGNYVRGQVLTIDPVVIFSTYTGSTADNFGYTGTYDAHGNGFAGGDVRGVGYPTDPGVVQANFGFGTYDNDDVLGDQPRDCAIMKLSPDGRTKLWATYLGGSRNEEPHSMIVDSKNNLLVLGSTFSKDFPSNKKGYQNNNKGQSDIFIIKISEDGTQILGMTYLGGDGRDGLNGRRLNSSTFSPNSSPLGYNFGDEFRGEIIVDKNDNVYVASSTESGNGSGFPAINSFNTTFGGLQDGCAFKLSPNLDQLYWGAYISGLNYESAFSLDINSQGDVYVCGGTNSSSMTFNADAYHPNYLGGIDGYVVKIQNDGSQMLGGTYIGTSSYDQAYFVKVDKHDFVYTTGQTAGTITPFPSNVYHSPTGGQFIYKLSGDLKQRLISMSYGDGISKPQISPTAFLVDNCERIFVSGWGGEENSNSRFPLGHGGNTARMKVTPDAYDNTTDGSDFYLAVFSKNLTKLVYATFIGGGQAGATSQQLGEHVDGGTSRFDPQGVVYQSVCGGCGGNSTPDFPTTPGAYSRTNNSDNCNNALFKLDFENLNAQPQVHDTTLTITALDTLVFRTIASDADEFDSLFITFSGEAVNGSNFPAPHIEPDQNVGVGVQQVFEDFTWISGCQHLGLDTIRIKVLVRDNGCPQPKSDSAEIKIVILPPPPPNPPGVICMTFITNDRLKLTWDIADTSGYLKYYILFRSVDGGTFEAIDTIYGNQKAEYVDATAFNHASTNYCYKMIGTNVCGESGQESYTICSIEQHNQPIENTSIYTTTVIDNKNIKTIWFQSDEPDFKGYTLYKRYNMNKAPWEFVQFFDAQTDTFFIDTHVKVQEYSYCYALAVKDKCGNNSAKCDPGCSILLQGTSIPFSHQLHWSPYTYWQQGIQQYDLWRFDDRAVDTLAGNGDSLYLKQTDTSLNYDWGGYWYRIIASELGGNQAQSQSNTIYLVQPPHLYVPTAFTRNQDGLNEVWGICDVFVKDYRLLVYNRWGQKVLDTDDKHFQWNGDFNSDHPFDNVFIWYVVYTGWDETTYTQKGTLTILR
ncbi:MAG: hypothetical protein GC180_04155 [Bacteroidetes bacterium]|nr:hypothetical protein [Bacteroidota bacterium]